MITARLLSRDEAAQYLGISVRTLDRLRATGHLRYIAECKHARVRFTQNDLDKYIRKCRKVV